jgi:hypothetical protein
MEELKKLLIEISIEYFSNHKYKDNRESYEMKMAIDSLSHVIDILGKNN